MLTLPRLLRAIPAALLLASSPALAGEIEVAPILVELGSGARTAIVSVRNGSAATMRYQVRAFEWDQTPDGQMVLAPAADLVLFPPLLELQPGEARNLRVGTSVAAAERERSWRIFVEEMPRADQADANRVQVLTRVGVPVFLAPAKKTSRGELALLERNGKRVRFALRNRGTVRLRPLAVRLTLVAADGAIVFERALDAWYVLAGGERLHEVEVPADACARAAEVVVVATLEAGKIEARAAGACGGP